MPSREHVDRYHLLVAVVLLGLLAAGFAYDVDYIVTVYGPVSYVWVGLVIAVLLAFPYRPVRTSWGWSVLFGAMVLAWGVHNVSGPGPSLVMGYGFTVLGAASIAYGIYERFAPPTWPDPPTIETGE